MRTHEVGTTPMMETDGVLIGNWYRYWYIY